MKKYKNAVTYMISSVLGKSLSFFVLPLYTIYLPPSEYGKWSVFHSILVFSTPLIGCVYHFQIARSFFTKTREYLKKLIFNVSITTILYATIATLFIAVLHQFKSEWLGIDIKHLYFLPLLALLSSYKDSFTGILRYEKQALFFAIVEIGLVVVTALGVVAYLHFIDKTWTSFIFASLFSLFLLVPFALLYCKKNNLIEPSFDFSIIKTATLVCVPLIPHSLGNSIISMSDRIILKELTSLSEVGVYSVAYAIGASILVVANAFNNMWGPWIYERLSRGPENRESQKIVRISYLYWLGMIIVCLAAYLSGFVYIKYLLDERYHGAVDIVGWVMFGVYFRACYFALFPYLTHLGKTKVFSWITGSSAAINIVASIILVKLYGVIGAAQGTFISYFYSFILVFIYSQKHHPMPWLYFLKGSKK